MVASSSSSSSFFFFFGVGHCGGCGFFFFAMTGA